jgi:type IV pilus assembly protein PilB
VAEIGDSLESVVLEKGWLSSSEVEDAKTRLEKSDHAELHKFLIEAKLLTEDQCAEALALMSGMEWLEGGILAGSPDATAIVSLEFARDRCVLPMKVEDDSLYVALADPMDLSIVDDLGFMSELPVVCLVAGETAIRNGIANSYTGGEEALSDMIDAQDSIHIGGQDEIEDVEDDDEVPVIALVNTIIGNAVRKGASDIHIESMETYIRVRYRVDGKNTVVDRPNKRLEGAMFGRIKLMAKMDIAEKRKPQDGPIKLKVDGRSIDLRVSTLPSSFGESIVMRILDKESVMKGVDQLGFHPTDYAEFSELIDRPNGIVLVTGPTGSGKTTTLYAALNAKNKPNVKIITAEDPVEYNVSGINQVQVNHTIGLNFSRILRAMLRQAPNVILVGEIRDHETAEIAIEASLTGHLVFSTLHTNDAPSSVTRLIDMGIKPYLVSAAVIAILAQRLIRLNCAKCVEPYVPSAESMIAAGITDEMADGYTFYRGAGCNVCSNTGYKGRLGIYELLKFNSELRQAIFKNEPTHVLREIALRGGMHTLLMDGVRKVFAGKTTVEEILRVAKSSDS